jgi:pimeloyl-ACP methyl ester carboxylesterase
MCGFVARVILYLTVALTCAVARPASAQPPKPAPAHADRFPMLTPCADVPNALCGTLEVQEDRKAPQSRKISLRVALVPALAGKTAPDPLFALTGGGPGVASVPDAENWPKAFPQLRETRDMVFIDQRGTGGSNPLDCSVGDSAAAVSAFIGGALSLELIAECRDRLAKAADLRAYTTAASADDIDDVRRWLGFDRINLYGASYASRLALVYAQRYPAHVRTITLKGATPPSLRNPLHTAADSQAALDRVFADCMSEASCQAAFPNLRKDFESVLERLKSDPRTVALPRGTTVTLTRDVFAGVIRRLLYSTDTQRTIPLAIAAAAREDFGPLQPMLGAGEAIDRALNLGLFLSVTCSEDVAAFDQAEVTRVTAGTFTGDALASPVRAACGLWPTATIGKDIHLPVHGSVNALIISGALDPQTPPRWGREMAKLVPGAWIIEAQGVAHSGIPRCLADVFESFVATASSKVDASCLKELRRPPFALPK